MKTETYKFEKYIAVLMVIMFFMAISNASGAEPNQFKTDESAKVRLPEKAHYSKLSQIDAKPQAGNETLDALTFPLADWGPLMSWKLLRTYYATKPLDAFRKYEMPAN